MSGTRTIDFGRDRAGLGHNLPADVRTRLIAKTGKVDPRQVHSALSSLHIDATDEDVSSVCEDLQTMRVTKPRTTESLDKVLRGVEQLRTNLPSALKELRENGKQSSLNAAFNLAAFDKALMKLMRAVDGAQRAATWKLAKQTWHDDAMWLALRLERIAAKSSGKPKLRFRASDGLTTRCISDLLGLAGIHQSASNVAKAIKDHPQTGIIG